MKSTGDRLGRREKPEGGPSLWDWITGEMIDTYFYNTGGSGELIVTTYGDNTNNEGICGPCSEEVFVL